MEPEQVQQVEALIEAELPANRAVQLVLASNPPTQEGLAQTEAE